MILAVALLCAAGDAWLPPSLSAGASLVSGVRSLLGLRAADVAAGALWQPFTYWLVHGNLLHLAVNVLALALTGRALLPVLGRFRLAVLLAEGALGGSVGFLLSLLFDPRLALGTVCLGASGMVAALLGAASLWDPRARVTLIVGVLPLRVPAWAVGAAVVAGIACEAVFLPYAAAYGAHAGGLLSGCIAALLWRARA